MVSPLVVPPSIVSEKAISKLKELLGDTAVGSNPILRQVAGTIYMHGQDYAEAPKHTNSSGSMEL
jgi:coatomer protein complex subunit epsilon